MSRGICLWCGLPGHKTSTCHVQARGAQEPDEADEMAQRILPSITARGLGDMRRDVAAAIREAMQR